MNFLKKLFYAKLESELRGCKRVLDLGCGPSSYLERFHGGYYSVGVDAYKPYLDEAERKGTYDEYILSDIMDVDFPEKSFDAVICCQVIEHLTLEDAQILLKKMERWATKKILITTPNCQNGFSPTEEWEAISDGFDRYGDSALMKHKSGWTVRDFTVLGYQKVRGYQGFERFFGKEGFGKLLYYASVPLSYFFPRRAHQLLAIKDMSTLK